jgi:hypothetical protein
MSNLTIIEHKAKRVLTTQQLAEVYETEAKNIQQNFTRNEERFILARDYYLLEGEELKAFKSETSNSGFAPNLNKLYLWTERGANRHCKILDTNKAWEQFDVLEETYFKVIQNKPMCLEDAIISSMQAQKEIRLQIEKNSATIAIHTAKINQIAAKIETSPTDFFTIAGYASLRGVKVDVNKANLLGRKAAKLSRETEIDIGRANDPRFGQVNTYHLDVLKEIFAVQEK